MKSSTGKAFFAHGKLCATRPSEFIFTVMTLIITMVSFIDFSREVSPKNIHPEYLAIDVLFMAIVRVGALLYTYHQFQSIYLYGSKYLLVLAIIFGVFSCIFFCCIVMKILDCDVSDLRDAIFFFLLLVDLNKVRYLAQFAIESSSYKEVQENIAEGVSVLGPSLTLDTMAEALLIGAGTLSGVSRVEQMCLFAVTSILVNYLLLMTFYPAYLSLALELSHRCSPTEPPWKPIQEAKKVSDTSANPILQRVKIIMSAGLFLVHGITRWSINPETQCISIATQAKNIPFEPPAIVKWLNAWLDQAVISVIVIGLAIKYAFFGKFWPSEEKMQKILKERSSKTDSSPKKTQNTQTESYLLSDEKKMSLESESRSLEESFELWSSSDNCSKLSDKEIFELLIEGKINARVLEKKLGDCTRGVTLRRSFIAHQLPNKFALDNLPHKDYDYSKVQGVCCENVIGYMQIPVGVVGPLKVNNVSYLVPLATTEGALVASTSRGCKALSEGAGVSGHLHNDGMTRAPVVKMPTVARAAEVKRWIQEDHLRGTDSCLSKAFNSTSNYARLRSVFVSMIDLNLYIRFVAETGDAMGMNMVAKGTEAALNALKNEFPDMKIVSISGNFCTDKKPSAVNWIFGRGKSVVCEATVSCSVVQSVLKTSSSKLVAANMDKNFIGSAAAGSIGGNNAQAANVIAALFIACGQDPAQVVESSMCMTIMEKCSNDDLRVSVSLPCIEVGTVGGGTALSAQSSCLKMLGLKGPSAETPGHNSRQLAIIAASTVMAGELSLLASLAEQTLVKSHLALNRKEPSTLPT